MDQVGDIYEVSEVERKTLGKTYLNTILSQSFYLWILTILLRVGWSGIMYLFQGVRTRNQLKLWDNSRQGKRLKKKISPIQAVSELEAEHSVPVATVYNPSPFMI